MTVELLLDNSAWTRLRAAALSRRRADEIANWIERGSVATCLPFLLEAGYSARSARDRSDLMEEFSALPTLGIDMEIERRAIDAQGQLARAGHHRLPPVDLIVAAVADRHGIGVLHYDADYDILAAKTDLRFASVWLADRGTL